MIWNILGQLILGAIAMLKTGSVRAIALNAVASLIIVWVLTLLIWSALLLLIDTKKIEHFHHKTLTVTSWGLAMLFAISLNF